MKRLLIYLIASLILLLIATLLSQFSFPSEDGEPYGKMIRIRQGEVMHSSSSLPVFRHFWKEANACSKQDTVIRIAVLAVGEADRPLRDSLILSLRKTVDDPRTISQWKWSKNWLPAEGRGEKFIFNRPSFAVNLQSANPQHDYTEAWVECQSDSGEKKMQLTIFCKNNLPGISTTFTDDVLQVHESEIPMKAGWQCLHFPFRQGKVQLNIECEESPLFGNITVEPVSGFSIWSVQVPELKNSMIRNELRMQAEILNPGMLILVCEKTDTSALANCIVRCRKLFGNKPILVYSSGLHYETAKQSWQSKAAFVSGIKTSSIGLVLQKDIHRFRKAG